METTTALAIAVFVFAVIGPVVLVALDTWQKRRWRERFVEAVRAARLFGPD